MTMKTQTGIWIDSKKALVISFSNGKEIIREITSGIESRVHHPAHEGDKGSFMGHRHINNESKIRERRRLQEYKFINQVLEELKNSDEIFIMGSAGMKHKLQNKLEEHPEMKKKAITLIPSGHLSLNQCVAKVKDFYKL